MLQHWRLRAVTELLTCAGEPQLCWRMCVNSSTGSHRRWTRCHTLHSAHSHCAFHNTGSAHEWASSVLRADKHGRTAAAIQQPTTGSESSCVTAMRARHMRDSDTFDSVPTILQSTIQEDTEGTWLAKGAILSDIAVN